MARFSSLTILSALALFSACNASSVVLPFGALTSKDKQHLVKVFDGADLNDLKSLHYATLGNAALNRPTKEAQKACTFVQKFVSSEDVEQQYYALSAASRLPNCKINVATASKVPEGLKRTGLNADQVFYIVSSANILNVAVDKTVVLQLLSEIANKDPSAMSLATALATAAILKKTTTGDLQKFSSFVKKIIEQADEADGTMLYFEKGTYTTAFVVDSILAFSKAIGKAPEITEEQVIKFTNSLFNRRRAQQVRTASRLASALNALATNSFITPVVVMGRTEHEWAGRSGLWLRDTASVELHLQDVMGRPLGAVKPTAGGLFTLVNAKEPALLGPTSRGALTAAKAEGSFLLDLQLKDTPVTHGRYHLELSIKPADSKKPSPIYAGATNAKIPVFITSEAKVDNAHIVVTPGSERSRSTVDIPVAFKQAPKIPAEASGSSSDSIKVLQHDRLRFSFRLTGAGSAAAALQPHQVFVQFIHSKTAQSITYVCQMTSDGTYSFQLNAATAAPEFDHLSGVYTMHLIVGDVLISKPIAWQITKVDMRFSAVPQSSGSAAEDVARQTVASVTGRKRAAGAHPRVGDGPSAGRKAELHHTFRKPEPRPANWLALTFTGLCVAPLPIVMLAWPIMGANLWNFPIGPSALFFHVGLGGIFALYVAYWFQLNMFITLRYLLFIGLFTFFFGNRVLRHLGQQRRKAEGGDH